MLPDGGGVKGAIAQELGQFKKAWEYPATTTMVAAVVARSYGPFQIVQETRVLGACRVVPVAAKAVGQACGSLGCAGGAHPVAQPAACRAPARAGPAPPKCQVNRVHADSVCACVFCPGA